MTKQYLAIIGGSGLYQMDGFTLAEKREVVTPFGKPSSALSFGKLSGVDVVFLARHGEGHVLNPSEINYRANIWALKSVGVKAVFSVSAVGSLREEIVPGHMVIPDQLFDRTKDRPTTFFEKGIVAHVAFAHPFSEYLRELLRDTCNELGIPQHFGGTYVCMEGPLFSTKAESHFYRSLNASVIGMTNLNEAKLAREAELDYATLALATDYDCWHEGHDAVTTAQVIEVMRANVSKAQQILSQAVTRFDFGRVLETQGMLKNAIMTDRKKIAPEVVERLKPILEKYFTNL